MQCSDLHGLKRGNSAHVVELQPSVQQAQVADKKLFVGELCTKEIRRVSDQDCFGVSVSRLAAGPDRKAVVLQVSEAARELARRYAARGYKVKLRRVSVHKRLLGAQLGPVQGGFGYMS